MFAEAIIDLFYSALVFQLPHSIQILVTLSYFVYIFWPLYCIARVAEQSCGYMKFHFSHVLWHTLELITWQLSD